MGNRMFDEIEEKLQVAEIAARQVEGRINVYCSNSEQVAEAKEIISEYPVQSTSIKYDTATKIEVKEK